VLGFVVAICASDGMGHVYGGRISLYAGKTEVARSETMMTTPVVCPTRTPWGMSEPEGVNSKRRQKANRSPQPEDGETSRGGAACQHSIKHL
jgi:hypothetical protein